jgi:hypothetical protein
MLLEALTRMKYSCPSLSPETEQFSAPLVVQVSPPGVAFTVYPVMAEPPSDRGAVHETAAPSSTGP